MEQDDLLNRGHGPAAPQVQTPSRAPHSVRRTTTIDILRPPGFAPGLTLIGRGRDLKTLADSSAVVLERASFEVDVEFPGSRQILSIETLPDTPAMAGLVGQGAMTGFRRRLAELSPGTGRTLLLHLLDDIPGSTLISGHSQFAEPAEPGAPLLPILMQRNVCAGWRDGGTLASSIDDGDMIVVRGPLVRERNPTEDALAWHEMPTANPADMRRHRLLDLTSRTGGWRVRSHFRDSHWPLTGPTAGAETVIHEYALTADITTDLVLDVVQVTPLVLPWNECLATVESASRLGGTSLASIDQLVRSELRGATSCTHLNDVLRSLAGITTMVGALAP